MPCTKEEYVKYLITSQINHTQTYMGDRHFEISHDQLNRFMRSEKLRPRHLWQSVREDVVADKDGCLLFDDTTLNKEHSEHIEMAQVQYSGAKHGLIMGINVVTCVYYNPKLNQHWIIDYRIFNPIADGKTKLDHVEDMLKHTVEWKKLFFRNVLFDTWYATNDLMKVVNDLEKYFYCPVKEDRNVFQGINWTKPKLLPWDEETLIHGQGVRLKGQKKRVSIRMHRLDMPTRATEPKYQYIVTNDIKNDDSQAVANTVSHRWKVEELHREVKQLTAIERCQCRKARAQRNHIVCSLIAWTSLKRAAYALKTTAYNLKTRLLDDYMILRLNSPLALVIYSHIEINSTI